MHAELRMDLHLSSFFLLFAKAYFLKFLKLRYNYITFPFPRPNSSPPCLTPTTLSTTPIIFFTSTPDCIKKMSEFLFREYQRYLFICLDTEYDGINEILFLTWK